MVCYNINPIAHSDIVLVDAPFGHMNLARVIALLPSNGYFGWCDAKGNDTIRFYPEQVRVNVTERFTRVWASLRITQFLKIKSRSKVEMFCRPGGALVPMRCRELKKWIDCPALLRLKIQMQENEIDLCNIRRFCFCCYLAMKKILNKSLFEF